MIRTENLLNRVKKSLSSLQIDYSKEVNSSEMFTVGKCPICNDDIIQTSGVYSCRGKLLDKCDFKRDALFEGQYVSFEEVLRFEKYQKMMNSGFNHNNSSVKTEPISNRTSNPETTKQASNTETVKMDTEPQVLGACPKCGKNVIDKKSKYACCECDYKLNKTFFNTEIKPEIVKTLLKGDYTDLMQFTNKNGETEESRLMLDNKNFNYALAKKIRSNQTNQTSELGKCPICNKNVIAGKNAFGCFGVTDGTCNFKIPARFDQMSIHSKDIVKLLNGETIQKEESFLKINVDGILEKVPF